MPGPRDPDPDRVMAVAQLAAFGIDETGFATRERRLSQRAGRDVTPDDVFWSLATELAIRSAAAGRWHDASELHLLMARRRQKLGGDARRLRLEAERFRVRHIVTSNGDRPFVLEVAACDCDVCAPWDGRTVTAGEILAGTAGIPHAACSGCTCRVQARTGSERILDD